jgi:hypothetical protein
VTAVGLIADLHARGVTLVADGERLRCRPRFALSDDDLGALRAHKSEVLARLRSPTKAALVCPTCRERRFWRSTYGRVTCGVCHPPAAPELVERWLSEPGNDATADHGTAS